MFINIYYWNIKAFGKTSRHISKFYCSYYSELSNKCVKEHFLIFWKSMYFGKNTETDVKVKIMLYR